MNEEGRAPPDDRFFFTTGVVPDPAGNLLYVTNGNTDLRFNGGSLVVLDFAAALRAWAEGRCTASDPVAARTPVCLEMRPPEGLGLVLPDRSVRIGSFAGQPAVQRFRAPRRDPSTGRPLGRKPSCLTGCECDPSLGPSDPGYEPTCIGLYDIDPSQGMRLLIPVRGDPSLTWVHVTPDGRFECGQPGGAIGACDATHRLSTLVTDAKFTLAPEPFGVTVSEDLGYAAVAHLAGATISLFDVGDGAAVAPSFVASVADLFALSATGSQGAYGVAVRPFDPAALPASCPPFPRCLLGDYSVLYATSRFSPRIGQLFIRGAEACRPGLPGDTCAQGKRTLSLVPSAQIAVDAILVDGGDLRDIKFNRAGDRAYAINRRPPSVLEIDTSSVPAPPGEPRNFILRVTEVCGEPSLLTLREGPGPLRIYVSCFSAGQIYVIDPALGALDAIVDVGRGPNAVVLVPGRPLRGVVTNFADNNLSVLDLEPGSPTENTVLFKIGYPRPVLGTRR